MASSAAFATTSPLVAEGKQGQSDEGSVGPLCHPYAWTAPSTDGLSAPAPVAQQCCSSLVVLVTYSDETSLCHCLAPDNTCEVVIWVKARVKRSLVGHGSTINVPGLGKEQVLPQPLCHWHLIGGECAGFGTTCSSSAEIALCLEVFKPLHLLKCVGKKYEQDYTSAEPQSKYMSVGTGFVN